MTDTPATGPAVAGASPAPGGQPDDGVLLILAADHRNSLERDLVMEYLTDRGVEPAIWKVEGLDRHDEAVPVAAHYYLSARDGMLASQPDPEFW